MEERVQKLFSAAGVCSRRTAEAYMIAGRITVNGVAAVLGQRADPERDDIRLDGVLLPRRERKVYIMLNKPRGYVTTLSDERGRSTVRELVADCGARVCPAGRLDRNSEGLLIMTNDGDLIRRLTHPAGEVEKAYWLSAFVPEARGMDISKAAERLSRVRELDGERIRPAQVKFLRTHGRIVELEVVIHEGRKRQIRRMCEQCGLFVKRLRRIREHTLELGEIPPGQWRYLTETEIASLKSAGSGGNKGNRENLGAGS